MAFLGDFFGEAGNIFGLAKNALYVLVGVGVLIICGLIIYYFFYKKKNWNLDVEFKIPRSDGRLTFAEWGRGNYDNKRGCVFVKRKGKKPVAMKPFDPKKYIQGEKILTVIQIAPEQYVPVAHETYTMFTDDKTNEEVAVMNLSSDLSQSKSWARSFERDAKSAYSIMNLLKEYAPMIGIGIILFMNFAGFAILYSKVS